MCVWQETDLRRLFVFGCVFRVAVIAAMVMAPQPPRELTAEELEPLEHWFESCNGAQQAIIAVKLLSRANPKAAHLIHSFLQQRLLVANAIWRQEIQRANDPGMESHMNVTRQCRRLDRDRVIAHGRKPAPVRRFLRRSG